MGEKPGETVGNEEGSVRLENKGRLVCSYMGRVEPIALSTGPHGTPSCPEEGHGHQIRYFSAASILVVSY